MKYKEIFEQIINEINMSPAGLRSLVANINAQAGMEFEMIVPGAAESDEGDDYQEPDYDSDESIRSIQDAYDFFYDGDFNGRRDVENLRDQMTEQYQEWLSEKVDEKWEEGKVEAIYDWLRYNAAPSEVFDILGVEANESGDYPDPEKKDYGNAALKVAEDQINPWYEDAEEDFRDNFYRDADMEEEWLEDNNIHSMQDVESNFNITWPHYHNPYEGGDVSIQDAADSFASAIGREVKASDNYHSRAVTRPDANNLHYVVEPDGSLEADDDQDGGLEFVSPALPINELLDDLKKVKAWADKTGCYTNDSTGLHINVSVPNWKGDMSQLDYVKLAVLMGDEYVLEEFGRTGNTYAKSALKMVKEHIAQRPEDTKALLDKMREHLNTSAAKVIHSGSTSKYTSINTKTGYIEFRSPGGDWLNENFDKIENTLYRFVVALDAAVDETKYKQEYAKKLYKLLTGDQKDSTNTMAYFAKYAAGELPQSALKSFIRQAQFERSVGKEPNGKQLWWKVTRPGFGASVEVVATSREEAIEKGKKEYPDWSRAQDMDAKPIRKYEEPTVAPYDPDGKFIISKFRADGPNTVAYRFSADTWNKAEWSLKAWLTANNITDRDDVRKYSLRFDPEKSEGQAQGFSATRQSAQRQRYEIYNKQTGNSVEDAEGITNDSDALIRLNDYIEHGPHALQRGQATAMFGIRRVGGRPVEPIRATVGAPQPAGSVGRSQTDMENRMGLPDQTGDANYEIVDRRTGRRVFVMVANTEYDARRKYADWLSAAGYPIETEDYGFREINQQSTPRPIPGVTDIEPDISGPDIRPASPRTDRPFVWKVIGSSQSPYQSQGTEVVARSEFEAMQKARQQWNLNTSGATEEQFFSTNGWSATPVRPAPVAGSTQDLQQQRSQGGFTGSWKVTVDGEEVYRFSGIGNNQADANRIGREWARNQISQGLLYPAGDIEVLPIMS